LRDKARQRVVLVLIAVYFCLFSWIRRRCLYCEPEREAAAAAASGMFGRPATGWTEVLGNFLMEVEDNYQTTSDIK
jgi:hypothetical protein